MSYTPARVGIMAGTGEADQLVNTHIWNHPHPRPVEPAVEGCALDADDLQARYQHVHRYHLAAAFAAGRRVADLASGDGYGSAILAASAASVVGIAADHDAAEHARHAYRLSNVSFVHGSMLDPTVLAANDFDIVTCLDESASLEDFAAVLDIAVKYLREEGVLLISMPTASSFGNWFEHDHQSHRDEWERDALAGLLLKRFAHVALWGQMPSVGSLVFPLRQSGGGDPQLLVVDGLAPHGRLGDTLSPPYLVAAASQHPLPALPTLSTLVDPEMNLVRRAVRERDEAWADASNQRAAAARLNEQVASLEESIREIGRELTSERERLHVMTASRGWRAVMLYRTAYHGIRRTVRQSAQRIGWDRGRPARGEATTTTDG